MNGLVMTGATADEIWPLVRDFHYSRRSAGLVQHAFAWRNPGGLFGETGEPVAGITYSQPVNRNFPHDSLELSRLVRRDGFTAPLSAFVAWTLRWLRGNTERPFVLSYADTMHGHHGGIYQACGFVYIGPSDYRGIIAYRDGNGRVVPSRTYGKRYGTRANAVIQRKHPDLEPVYGEPKHLYIFPLRQKWNSISKSNGWQRLPFPKPSAARLLDEPAPTGASEARTLGAAPIHANERTRP